MVLVSRHRPLQLLLLLLLLLLRLFFLLTYHRIGAWRWTVRQMHFPAAMQPVVERALCCWATTTPSASCWWRASKALATRCVCISRGSPHGSTGGMLRRIDVI